MKTLLGLITFLAASMASAQQLQLQSVEYAGTGCPQGSVTAQLAPDGSALTVLYDRFDLRVGADTTQGMQDCKIVLRLKKPLLAGFRIESADFRGFIYLDPGVVADQQVRVGSGSIKELRQITTEFGYQRWQGPVNQNFNLTTVRPLKTPPILDCIPPRENTQIVIESKIRVGQAGGSRIGQLTVDSVDGRIVQRYNLKWVNCLKQGKDLIGGLIGRR